MRRQTLVKGVEIRLRIGWQAKNQRRIFDRTLAIYGYPPQEAAAVALRTVSAWLSSNPNYGMAVVMSCFDQKTRQCCQNVIDACAPGKE